MINCPNCGAAVASNQRFCGSCGADVQAAMSSRGAPVTDNVQAPYAYAQPSYDYNQGGYAEPSRGPMRMVIIVAVLALVACCMFACGILIGIEIPDILGLFGVTGGATPKPTPRFTPTPQSMMMIYYYLIG